ncbi:MAG: biopolymer transporter ExbD [Myxococcaceae bacterium]|nr:biopolymer transporter ExbD [Myxococcaceae bacterium]
MAFHVSKRKLKPKEEEEAGELNIVPYLDILMNLIIFMLLSMTGLATFGILNVSAPTYGGGGGGGNPEEKPPLLLTVAIAKNGFYIAATGGVLPGIEQQGTAAEGAPPTVGKKGDGTYDYDALNAKMKEIKTSFPDESKVILAAEADTSYEILVSTMDATRETVDHKLLFPDVTLASF